ncbi:hypothetical protein TCSYLVIO_004673 [Trypanosoma cruzi]|uniref:C3H1-type domain-containing protein n=1 Tax=Trypanosoma cruzi Dm28c TaxID=1416333 RepID=V5B3J9_TRYCR|nr:hypothetical protein TCSYLVIO_004673 [Trypanosoma cruzi]ESS67765.1 hypothetical protein TCDM_03467 [Trypanosoma cruzi Dm28c]PBJ75457.1 hypothetical protein BCY84_11285 [Trypanosoma cruzi cruzi]
MTTSTGGKMWDAIHFYKAYLPPAESNRTLQYVVLALDDESSSGFAAPRNCSVCVESTEKRVYPLLRESVHVRLSDGPPMLKRDCDIYSASSSESNEKTNMQKRLRFFLCKKEDVVPPQLKQLLGKVNYCFLLCGKSLHGEACSCNKAHFLNKSVWRLELSTFGFKEFYVSSSFYVHCIKTEQIRPTAGFLFACGLLHEGVIEATQPILCRYSERCRYGSRCLFVHADIRTEERTAMQASLPLKSLLKAESRLPMFLSQLDELGLHTVGDVQQLSNNAFDAIVARSEPCWLVQWLNIALVRDIQTKHMLKNVLATFPDIATPVSLPPCLTNVLSLIQLSVKEFYSLVLPVKVQAACEQIRTRFEPDRHHNIVDLRKEPEGSFLSKLCPIIMSFRQKNAHVSWRKKDPNRPVVTSLITYIDPEECDCQVDCSGRGRPPALIKPNGREGEEKHPRSTWCTCTRSFVLAVNYELSTPSGSRCSEQNALGKLASMGLPTSAIREIFVHGEMLGSKKDPNPLFPCGVCENMLRKVTRDVHDAYGGDVVLYMFDSTVNPKKLVYLPINEISYRGGSGFKKFLADLRDE